ncbi:MAG: hypothetical protein PUP46_01980 [Endozoicomonas sp. (ex Botrylloides leachii)]|nr:hypothetical protein [Endozoicomonas sp. (ex Botrylloides leachii)]
MASAIPNTPAFGQTAPSSDIPVASASASVFSERNVASSRGNTILSRLKNFTGYYHLPHAFNHFKSVLGRKITLLQKVVPEYFKAAAYNAMLKLSLYKDESQENILRNKANDAKARTNPLYSKYNNPETEATRESSIQDLRDSDKENTAEVALKSFVQALRDGDKEKTGETLRAYVYILFPQPIKDMVTATYTGKNKASVLRNAVHNAKTCINIFYGQHNNPDAKTALNSFIDGFDKGDEKQAADAIASYAYSHFPQDIKDMIKINEKGKSSKFFNLILY